MAPLLAATGVGKRFGPVTALDEVDLALRAGKVHALVGENGAGKSTLTGVLAGALRPDSGELRLDGAPVRFTSRSAAISAGVGLVPQALSLVGELTLVENHRLSAPRGRGWGQARQQVAEAARRADVDLPLDRRCGHLPFAERQLGEVVLALAEGARVLLLDEPTAALGPVEATRLLDRVRAIADEGAAVVLVTHRLDEALRIADEVTVLRAGRRVHHGPAGDLDPTRLAALMINTAAVDAPVGGSPPKGKVRLTMGGLKVAGGEILGIAGVAGSGQDALVEELVGLRGRERVTVDGVDVTGDPAAATARGVAYLPGDRADGVLGGHTVSDNAVLLRAKGAGMTVGGMRRRGPADALARRVCERFGVRPPRPRLLAAALSGGNQQKLMAGRELDRGAAVIVAHGPTQGLDFAAASALHGELRAAARAGAAVVLVSTDLDEVLALADRVAVLVGGRLVGEQPRGAVDTDWLGRTMAGLR